jgi:hypothetical protein
MASSLTTGMVVQYMTTCITGIIIVENGSTRYEQLYGQRYETEIISSDAKV